MTPAKAAPQSIYQPPIPIRPDHHLASFRSGRSDLDSWLKTHALGNEGKVSRTYVVTAGDDVVIAYYTLANGSLERGQLPRNMRHDTPPSIPAMILGRLAVDVQHTGLGIGSHLLKQAMLRTREVSEISASRVLVVHAIDEEAVSFYLHYGFKPSPIGRFSLILPIEAIAEAVLRP